MPPAIVRGRHVRDVLCSCLETGFATMSLSRSLLLRASRSPWLADQVRRRAFTRRAVRRFMPGEDLEAALAAAANLAQNRIGTVLTNLGERVTSPAEAAAVEQHY